MLGLLAETVASRYAAGQAEQEAVVKVQVEVSRIGERLADVTAERAMRVADLNLLRDRPGDTPLGTVEALPAVDANPDDLESRALASAPEEAVRRAEIRAAERKLASARLETKPDFLVGVGAGSTLAPDPVISLRFGITVPTWGAEKQGPEIAAARHDLESAQDELRETEAAIRSESARLAARWRRDVEQVVRYREAIVPQTDLAMDAARASYLAGRGDFTTVVDDFRLWVDARTQLAHREADRFETWAEIEALVASRGEGGEGEPR